METVTEGGPAEQAGIRGGDDTVTLQGLEYIVGGDVIVKVDDAPIESFDDLIGFLADKKPGDKVEVEVVRDGETKTIDVTLGERPESM